MADVTAAAADRFHDVRRHRLLVLERIRQDQFDRASTFGLDEVSCSVFGNYDSCHYSNHGGVYPSPDSTTTLAPGLYDLLVTALDYGADYPGGGQQRSSWEASGAAPKGQSRTTKRQPESAPSERRSL
jgi:hypothetical protein